MRKKRKKKHEPQDNRVVSKISSLEPGMRLASDVEHRYGSILLKKGTILDKKKIHRLQGMGIKKVAVYRENTTDIEKNIERTEELERNYRHSIDSVDTIFNQVKEKGTLKKKLIQNITEKIYQLGNEHELITLLTDLKQANKYPYHHLLNMGLLGYLFGNWLNFDEERSLQLARAGLLHDIGMALVPSSILYKPEDLTTKEFKRVKVHPLQGYNLIKELDFISRDTALGVLSHHERYDGTGYPLQLEGNKIPLFGRILAIIDTFNAITSERVYQPRISPFEAIKLFREDTLGAFDYNLVKIFLDNIPDYFVNKKVMLNDGRQAEVVYINPRHPDQPIIYVDEQYIDLYKNDVLKINYLLEEK